jgi:hypothetical protein
MPEALERPWVFSIILNVVVASQVLVLGSVVLYPDCTITTLGSSILQILVSEEAEKFDLWRILRPLFSGCDL